VQDIRGKKTRRRHQGFQVGELVMVHLSKDHYPKRKYNNFNAKKFGPCQIKRIF